ncbi:hypothetical protein GCM10027360_53660 [Amycolatopsis echigonensis]
MAPAVGWIGLEKDGVAAADRHADPLRHGLGTPWDPRSLRAGQLNTERWLGGAESKNPLAPKLYVRHWRVLVRSKAASGVSR